MEPLSHRAAQLSIDAVEKVFAIYTPTGAQGRCASGDFLTNGFAERAEQGLRRNVRARFVGRVSGSRWLDPKPVSQGNHSLFLREMVSPTRVPASRRRLQAGQELKLHNRDSLLVRNAGRGAWEDT